MAKNKQSPENKDRKDRKTILDWLFAKPPRDEDYGSDLKAQWAALDRAGRIKFIFGALIGLVLFTGVLYLVYLALAALIH